MAKKVVIVFVVVVLAVIGATIGYFVTKSDSNDASNASGTNGSSSSNSTSNNLRSTGNGNGTSRSMDFSLTNGSTEDAIVSKITSDPTGESYKLSAFAIGDWGATTYSKNGSCCSRRKDNVFNAYDRHAEAGVAKLMGMRATELKPKVVLGHGDNFYWSGILGATDQTYRFDATFESKYDATSLLDVTWVNVMGNHDYGGGSYVCSDGTDMIQCGSTTELMTALKDKFTLQAGYKSPNNDRWKLSDHFYVHTIKDGDVSIDIFNVDTNDADTHAADQICCQCYGYSEGDDDKICKTITRGHKWCAGGDTGMYDTCMKQFTEWGDEAKAKLAEEVKKSTATWKVVNSHYSPYNHYGGDRAAKWMDHLKDIKDIQVWINGHTHGEKHDFAAGHNMHFIENGAGGGIQSEAASGIPDYAKGWVKNVWTGGGLNDGAIDGNTYGFFELAASKDWLKVSFFTFDDKWKITKDDDSLTTGTIGGVVAKHCWYIPVDGTAGRKCT